MKRSTALAAAAALFLVGIAVGVLATHLFYLRQAHHPGGLARVGTRWLAGNLERRLDLTPEQRRQVDAILAETERELAAVRRRTGPELRLVLERTHRRIEAILTPEQRQELHRFRRRHHHRMEELLHGPPGRRRHDEGVAVPERP